MPPETMTAPPVAPTTESSTPDAPKTTGADSLRAAIRSFGQKYTTVADDDPRAKEAALPTAPLQHTAADGDTQGGAATQDGTAPAAPGPVQGADGRWRNPDGSFARDPNAPAEETPTGDIADKAAGGDTAAASEEPETVPFTLKGLRANGETDEEIEVPKALEERFRRLTNDANRYREVVKRLDLIEAKEADFQMLEARMRAAPDAFVLSRLSPEVQQRLAVQLVADHWDAIIDKLVMFDKDPASRQLAAKDNQIRIRDAERQMEHEAQKVKAATRALRMIEDMIPEGATESRANRFVALAKQEIDREYQSQRGAIPSPDRIKALLTEVARDMGFDETPRTDQSNGAAPENANGTKTTAPQAKPAQGTARKPSMTPAERQAAAQRSRVVAKRVAPAGAGGAPVQAPVVPPTDPKSKAPIKDRIAFLRANPGILRTTSE